MNSEILQVLAEGLSGTVTSLDISGCNQVGSGDALVAFSRLEELHLEGMMLCCRFTNAQGLTSIDFSNLNHLRTLRKLNMALTGKHTLSTMEAVAGLSNLVWLNLHGCQHLREDHLKVCFSTPLTNTDSH